MEVNILDKCFKKEQNYFEKDTDKILTRIYIKYIYLIPIIHENVKNNN